MSRKLQDFSVEQPVQTKTFTTAKGDTFTRTLYKVDRDYSLPLQQIIWSHGRSNYNIWFLNKENKLCRVKGAKIYNGNLYLTVTINCKDEIKAKDTQLSIDRFLYLYEIGEFKITFKRFVDTYLIPLYK